MASINRKSSRTGGTSAATKTATASRYETTDNGRKHVSYPGKNVAGRAGVKAAKRQKATAKVWSGGRPVKKTK